MSGLASGYTEVTVLHAEGARVGILVCEGCGAAILIDPREKFSATERHDEWHRKHDRKRHTLTAEDWAA